MSKLEDALKQAISARNKNLSSTEETPKPNLLTSPAHALHKQGNISAMTEDSVLDKAELEKNKLVSPDMSNAKLLDQFREIRTHIYQVTRHKNLPILVTSVANNAGNSFVTQNIAAAISLDDAKTSLIVDCNLHDPGFHSLLNGDEQLGVTDYIDSNTTLEQIIKPVGIKRMRIIPAGAKKESVTDYLTSSRLRNLFVELQERYSDRIILVDSPSINESADAKILVDIFSYVVLVVPYRKVSEAQIISAIKAIGKEKIIGIVINREPQFLSLFKYKK